MQQQQQKKLFSAFGKASNEPSAVANRNAEIVTHMSKMCLETFKEEDDLIRKEIESGNRNSAKQQQQVSERKIASKNSRRIIRIDDIDVVRNQAVKGTFERTLYCSVYLQNNLN